MDKTTGKLIGAFVMLIIAAVLIGVIASSTQYETTLSSTGQIIDISPARLTEGAINDSYFFHLTKGCPYSTWRAQLGSECQTDVWAAYNNTAGALTETTDYVVYATNPTCTGANAGDISFVNSANVNDSASNTTVFNYRYCRDDYLNSSFGRVSMNLIPGFFAIAALMIGVGLFYSVGKDYGIW